MREGGATYHVSQVAQVLRAIDGRLGADVAAELSEATLYSVPEDVDQLAALILAALLGGLAARAALEDRTGRVPAEGGERADQCSASCLIKLQAASEHSETA